MIIVFILYLYIIIFTNYAHIILTMLYLSTVTHLLSTKVTPTASIQTRPLGRLTALSVS